MLQNVFGDLSLEETNKAILLYLVAILEKMPRVTGNDQAAVTVEGTVVSTVTNQTQIGGQEALTVARNQMMPVHIYNNIVVS
jgi:hypothetical protein